MGKSYNNYIGEPYSDFNVVPKTERWGIIRQMYMECISKILATSKKDINSWIDVNFLEWQIMFSPIEKIGWDIIRSRPYMVMYPQFPLFNHFIDFANPFLKIGIELDGKDYHDKLKVSDQVVAITPSPCA